MALGTLQYLNKYYFREKKYNNILKIKFLKIYMLKKYCEWRDYYLYLTFIYIKYSVRISGATIEYIFITIRRGKSVAHGTISVTNMGSFGWTQIESSMISFPLKDRIMEQSITAWF